MKTPARLIALSVVAFVVLSGVAMVSYPGGSWLDPDATGHDLARNFLCDVLGPVAINGRPNPVASRAMAAAMGIVALGMSLSWWSLSQLMPQSRLRRPIRVLSVVALGGLLLVPLTPPTLSYALHAGALFAAGLPTVTVAGLTLAGLARGIRTRGIARFGMGMLVAVMVGFVLYAHQYFLGGSLNIYLPISHRIATVLFLLWLLGVSRVLADTPS